MEDVQKNENGTTAQQADGKPKKENKPKRELTPQQVQQRRKMIVFPLMFLAFAGCMYLIFAPSGKEDVNVESVGGFNADIPLPAEDGIIADKQKAYEQAVTSRKQQDKIQSLQDFGFTLDDDTEEPQEEINLLPEEDPKPQRGGGASSRAAYRDINRQLSTFYETPPVDEEKEELKRQVAELTDRLKQQQNATPTADDQMALLEKVLRAGGKVYERAGRTKGTDCPNTDSRAERRRYRHSGYSGAGYPGNDRFGIAAAHERCRLHPGLQPATKLRLQHGGRHGVRYGKEHGSRLHTPRPNAGGRAGGETPVARTHAGGKYRCAEEYPCGGNGKGAGRTARHTGVLD